MPTLASQEEESSDTPASLELAMASPLELVHLDSDSYPEADSVDSADSDTLQLEPADSESLELEPVDSESLDFKV